MGFLYHSYVAAKLSLMVEQDTNIVTIAYSGSLTARTKLLFFKDRKDQEISSFFLLICNTLSVLVSLFCPPHSYEHRGGVNGAA